MPEMTRAELTERLARALCRSDGHDPDTNWALAYPNNPDPGYEAAWENYTANARAILSELDALGLAIVPKDADEAMIGAGVIGDPLSCDVDESDFPLIYGAIWRAMLAAGAVK